MARASSFQLDRRTLLIGGGVGAGLLVAWSLWPRHYAVNLRAGPGESIFNAFLKIAEDGRVIVAVPQTELGQGVFTSLPQILADELGADWRTVGVEAAPISPIYANGLLAGEIESARLPAMLDGVENWAIREYATRHTLMLTGGSTSVRAFETRMREAGSAARALLSKAAARRWKTDWELLDTGSGFVWNGKQRLSFGELAADAAGLELPDDLPVRGGDDNRLTGESLPRIDIPSKVDGSAQFAADVRLPGMRYASVRQGPVGKARLVRIDRDPAQSLPGVVKIVEMPGWVAVVATNWWAANHALEMLHPRFEVPEGLVDADQIDRALSEALAAGSGKRIFSRGNAPGALDAGDVIRADYVAGLIPNAAMETLTATAWLRGGRLEIWAPTQAPELARAAAARGAGIGEGRVTLFPMLAGNGYGRKLEMAAIEQVAALTALVERPVQLTWSRIEETLHDSFRPAARARLEARFVAGKIQAWRSRIAAPSTLAEVKKRIRSGRQGAGGRAEAAAVAGAVPPYAIEAVAIEHHPVRLGVPTGIWRSQAHGYTAFFTETFVDELARKAQVEPLSFRMQMLARNPRLARVLSTAAMIGGWDGGGAGSAMGIAAHSAFGSHAALVVEVEIGPDSRIRVRRATCAVDCGRIVNPEIVRQLVEGGIMFGIAGATGRPIRYERGLPAAKGFGDLGLPLLADAPEITVELVASGEDPGGVTELAVPPVAPAIGNALFALTGTRLRSVPLMIGGQ
jgi:isoquinoline 1-oxidoreductase beta subunit